ncbi:MAG: hypothetical protein KGM43_07220 [Planctomycetota bacterium]|nr:hypothetical protein [Planctomycetota bacterium]
MQTRIETARTASTISKRRRRTFSSGAAALLWILAGCGEPSIRELKNRGDFEALLTAVTMKNGVELEKDAQRIDARRAAGQISQNGYNDLQEIIRSARSGNWASAEKQAYELREKSLDFK